MLELLHIAQTEDCSSEGPTRRVGRYVSRVVHVGSDQCFSYSSDLLRALRSKQLQRLHTVAHGHWHMLRKGRDKVSPVAEREQHACPCQRRQTPVTDFVHIDAEVIHRSHRDAKPGAGATACS